MADQIGTNQRSQYQQNSINDHAELKIKTEKLTTFITSNRFDNLTMDEQEDLLEQSRHMHSYQASLAKRISKFK